MFYTAVWAAAAATEMDSIKKKMLSLSQATEEANSRASVYEQEMKKINEIADKFEEQV